MPDVQDILNSHLKTATTSRPEPAAAAPKRPKLPRELQGLVADGWDSASTLQPTSKPSFRARRTTAVAWKWSRIQSSARRDKCLASEKQGKDGEDDISLNHWVRIHNLPDYLFSRFNKKIKMLSYTDEEYDEMLQDPNWSKAQTGRLYSLCRRYDLRFLVVHDKFTHPAPSDEEGIAALAEEERRLGPAAGSLLSKNKSTEDLKARYYSMQKTLLLARNGADLDLKKQPLIAHAYNPEYEAERKEQLRRLFTRTTAQMAEVSQLVLENRKIMQAIKTLKKEEKGRSKQLKENGINLKKRKRQKAAPDVPQLLAQLPTQCVPQRTAVERKPGCFLRSSMLSALDMEGLSENKAMQTELQSLGFKKARPFSVPTEKVCTAYESLRNDIITYLNLYKHVSERESERDSLKATAQGGRAESSRGRRRVGSPK